MEEFSITDEEYKEIEENMQDHCSGCDKDIPGWITIQVACVPHHTRVKPGQRVMTIFVPVLVCPNCGTFKMDQHYLEEIKKMIMADLAREVKH